ncbi:MAG: hypothetical protein MZV64_59255 [Ignavibacteriales bacterium]|nr:hypothetical protein [Ignavibacteriales bacterium]
MRMKGATFRRAGVYQDKSIINLEVEMTAQEKRIPWYLWPFAAIWKLLAVIVEMTGRLVAMIIGIVLMIVGVLVSLTVVGAIVGIPLAIVGLLLFVKGIF